MKYYTYAFLREKDSETAKAGTPYYIGKGSGNRAYSNNGRSIPCPTNKSLILILKHFEKEADAFKHEIYMIAVFGRIDLGTGILRNYTDGGEGSSGYKHTPEHRQYISEIQKGKVIPTEVKAKMKTARNKRVISDETKRKTSATMKGRPHSPEHRQRLAEANRARAKREMAEKGK